MKYRTMFLSSKIIGLFKDDDGVKINTGNYCMYFEKTILCGAVHNADVLKLKGVFMYDNVFLHSPKLKKRFKDIE